MKKHVQVFLIFTIVFLASCNYILHPSRNYMYSSGNLHKPAKNESAGFKKSRKELRYLEAEDVTNDFFKIAGDPKFPEDTILFRKSVGEMLILRLKDLKIDSLHYDYLETSDSLSLSKGGRIYMLLGGEMYWKKNGKQNSGLFKAVWIPIPDATIIQITTFKLQQKVRVYLLNSKPIPHTSQTEFLLKTQENKRTL